MKLIDRMAGSAPVRIALTLAAYAVYAAVLGASLVPAVTLGMLAFRSTVGGGSGLGGIALFCLCAAGCLYVFFFCGLVLIGLLVRLFSLGVKPGRHPAASLVTLCWILAGGIATWAWRLMLPFVPMTFVSQMYYRLAGCRLGRDVYINTLEVNDPYLVSIGDNSVIGPGASITNSVIWSDVVIGHNTEISSDVVGSKCSIGEKARQWSYCLPCKDTRQTSHRIPRLRPQPSSTPPSPALSAGRPQPLCRPCPRASGPRWQTPHPSKACARSSPRPWRTADSPRLTSPRSWAPAAPTSPRF